MDLFGGELAIPDAPSAIKKAPKKPQSKELIVDCGGLFPLTETLSPDRFAAIFFSGSSAFYDMLGLVNAGKDIGTVAGLLNSRVIHLMRESLQTGTKHFVDSGAFGAFNAWLAGDQESPLVDFEVVFKAYDDIISGMPANALKNVWLVMPDIVGHPEQSLELLKQHRSKVLGYIASVNAIVPVQKSQVSAGMMAERIFEILGTRDITLGIPSKAAVMEHSDIATIRHNRLHFLGRASMDMALYSKVYAAIEHNPNATITCDANRIRSHLDYITHEHHSLIEECGGGGQWEREFDDTELLYEILHSPDWMTQKQVAAIANSYGVRDTRDVRTWLNAHRSTGLHDLIDPLDPDGVILMACAIPAAFDELARKHLSARLRACAIEETFN